MNTCKFIKVSVAAILCFIISTGLNAGSEIKAKINEAAPDFTLQDQEGKTIKLSDYDDIIVVLEWVNPDCPYTQRHYKLNTMGQLSTKYKNDVVWLAINSTYYMDNTYNKMWVDKHNLSYPILNDNSGEIGKLYGAKTTPHMFIVDSKGKLVYAGAIDDDPKGADNQVINFVDTALGEIISGKDVSIAETKSYGCSVKYKKS